MSLKLTFLAFKKVVQVVRIGGRGVGVEIMQVMGYGCPLGGADCCILPMPRASLPDGLEMAVRRSSRVGGRVSRDAAHTLSVRRGVCGIYAV